MAGGEADLALATWPKSSAYHWNVGLPNAAGWHIPMPKPAGGSRHGRILRQTYEKVELLVDLPAGILRSCLRAAKPVFGLRCKIRSYLRPNFSANVLRFSPFCKG